MFSTFFTMSSLENPDRSDEEYCSMDDSYLMPPFTSLHREEPSESLLAVLDDKNKLISNLKNQLQNQKMQLTHYIKKELNHKKIVELSATCTPMASVESLPVNMALNKFCRQTGLKTKLSQLHERMSRLDYEISNSLKEQEFVLRKIVSKLCEFVKLQAISGPDLRDHFGSFITDPLHVNLFNKLLTATLSLRRKLEGFKICSDRLIIIEEERNSLVEQVYSLPVQQRTHCDYLLRIQMEKAYLEGKIRRMLQNGGSGGGRRLEELNNIEKILYNLQSELDSSFLPNKENCINEMLKKINSEARMLLEMTKEQKRRFECESSKIKGPEPKRILLFINLAASAASDNLKKRDLDRYGIKTEEEIRLFELIKTEIHTLKQKIKKESEKEARKLKAEYDIIKEKLSQILHENSRTMLMNRTLQNDMEQLKKEQRYGIERLRQERDAYRIQVEDLQAIREAYAQLVERQPKMSQMESEFLRQIDQRDRRIMELESLVVARSDEIEELKTKISHQFDQIVVLNRFINLTRPNSPSHNHSSGIPIISKAVDSGTNRKMTMKKTKKRAEPDGYCYKVNRQPREEKKFRKSEPIFPRTSKRTTSILKKSNISTKNDRVTLNQKAIKDQTNTSEYSKEIKQLMRRPYGTFSNSDGESLSSLNFWEHQNTHWRDITQTVITNSEEVRRSMKMEKSSVFSVEIRYRNRSVDDAVLELDEYEMFKDVSRESVYMHNRQTEK